MVLGKYKNKFIAGDFLLNTFLNELYSSEGSTFMLVLTCLAISSNEG